jgi:protein-tyrosine phosphatase
MIRPSKTQAEPDGAVDSSDSPIRVDWVKLEKVPGLAGSPGRLGMTFLPGKHDEGSAGTHRRSLVLDVRRLRETHDVDAVVLLVQDRELDLLRVPNIAEVMTSHRIELIRYPIPDAGVPADRSTFRQLLDDIRGRLANGQNIAVACRGGLGRTGTVVSCLLRDGGLDPSAAIALTRATRRKAIEDQDQERFVETWGEL